MSDEKVISFAMLSVSYNIILQVLSRILSSVTNAVIFRFLTREALGVINVRLLLLYSTTHCLSREAFRRSCLSTFDKKILQQKFNLLWMIIPVGFLLSLFLRHIWLHVLEAPDPTLIPNYTLGVNVVLISVLIESLAEPLYVFSQSYHFVKLKVVNEGLMLTVRSLGMIIFLSWWPDSTIYCFCLSQILGSVVYTFSYYGYFYLKVQESNHDLLINSIAETFPKLSKTFVHLEDLKLVWSLFKQTLLKQLLTEGERYLMTFFSLISFSEQGLYDVVINLSSLAARLIFFPVENSFYILFTQLLPRNKTSHSQENITLCLTVLGNILKLMVLIGLTIWVFGISYSQLLLYLYGGTKLSSGIGLVLMRWQCFYVFLLAVNGISEGFKDAVMSRQEIDKYSFLSILLSVSFLLASYGLVTLFGSIGFILANCLNMLFRIIHSLFFIQNYFKVSKMWFCQKIMPNTLVLLFLFLVFCCTSLSEKQFCCIAFKQWIWHLMFGGWCFILLIFIIYNKEKALLSFIQEQWQACSKADAKPKSS